MRIRTTHGTDTMTTRSNMVPRTSGVRAGERWCFAGWEFSSSGFEFD
jgi:hypothetical protein